MSQIQVLIVEDEVVICEDLRSILTNMDYQVVEVAYTGEEAIVLLKEQHFDLVLLDINLMGRLDGVDVAQVINDNHKIPSVYITSYANKGVIERAKTTHPMGYLVKPFSEKDIYAALEIALYNFHGQAVKSLNFDRLNAQLDKKLTIREFEMLNPIYAGKRNSQIAEECFLSVNTIKTHIRTLFEKLDVHSRTEAMVRIREINIQ